MYKKYNINEMNVKEKERNKERRDDMK